MSVAWVLGAGGLLGSALCRALARSEVRTFLPAEPLAWDDEGRAEAQIEAAAGAFAAFVESANADWQIHWAAGLGTMGCARPVLVRETQLFGRLLAAVARQPALARTRGSLLLASSAGAIYAGATAEIVSEDTPIAPTTDYAREKLEQERMLADHVAAHPGLGALVARISTLYGPQGAHGRRRGIIAEIAHRVVRNQPVHIYVPLDTIRDYLEVDDAADALLLSMRAIAGQPRVLTRIFASGQVATLSEITAIFKRIAHRRPLLVTSSSPLGGLYKRRIQFRSVHADAASGRPPTSLVVGIARVLAAERRALAQNSRQPPMLQ